MTTVYRMWSAFWGAPQDVTRIYFLGIAGIVLISGCSAYIPMSYEKPGPNPEAKYSFDYTPKKGSRGKTHFAVLLVSGGVQVKLPAQSHSKDYSWAPATAEAIKKIGNDYANALNGDVNELLNAKGFRIIKAVENQQRATFAQRKQSTFSLTPKVEIEVSGSETVESKPGLDAAGLLLTNHRKAGRVSGTLTLKRSIVLEAYEPLTWQLIWTKTLQGEAAAKGFTYRYNYSVQGAGINAGLLVGEDTRPVALAALLEESYKNTMDELATYIDIDEFTMLSKQVKAIRDEARGVVR